MPKRGASELYVLNPDQVRQLVASALDLEERIVIKVPLYAGLRAGELVHMRRDWLVSDKELRIPPSMWCACEDCLQRQKHPGEWKPKSAAGARVVPLTQPVRDDVLALLQHDPNGLEVSRYVALRRVKRVMKRSGLRIPGLGDSTGFLHMLRATCATMLAAAGLNEAQLCYVFGWTDLKTAQRYIRLATARSNAADAMERAFK